MKDREHIVQAAAITGLPLVTFVRRAALREADRVAATETVATLSAAETRWFLVSRRKPFTPNAALRRALVRGDKLGIW